VSSVAQVLREKLGVKTVLGLTATATKATCASIVTHLSIPDGEQGIIKDVPLPNNLILSVSRDEFRDRALVSLLQGKRFKSCQSIIIYCTRREECERLARLIRTCLQVWGNIMYYHDIYWDSFTLYCRVIITVLCFVWRYFSWHLLFICTWPSELLECIV
jgi:superfamily II DNA helicase RecQ